MSRQRDEQFTKRVEFAETDDAEQVATGIVMVPDKVDRQRDFVREETITQFADQFEDFYDVDRADGGVMHAVWPSDHIDLEVNEVRASKSKVNGQDVPTGAWVQRWKFNDEELWQLVDDGILEGYSIGAVDVDWSDPIPQDDLPDDVAVPDAIDEDDPVYELQSGIVQEVSTVDIPAVPDAMILETKADAMKQLAEHLGNRDGFIDEAVERGHSEADAERLWDYLNRAVNVEGAGEPGKESLFARAGKAFLSAFSGDGSDDREVGVVKESRTLSRANRQRAMAAHDAMEDLLQSELDFEQNRFTDDEDVDFDIAEFGKTAPTNAAEDGSPDGGGQATDTMTDDDNPFEDAPEWARSLHDSIEENSKRIDEVAEGDEEKDAEAEGGDGGEEKDADPFDDAPEWATALKESTEENAQRIDDVATAAGASQQIGDGDTETVSREYDETWDKTFGLPTGGEA